MTAKTNNMIYMQKWGYRQGFLIILFLGFFIFLPFLSPAFSQNKEKKPLSSQVVEAESETASMQEGFLSFNALKELADKYFSEFKYNEFIEYLSSLKEWNGQKEALLNYYAGLTRYRQLKYLEESQNWNEYFNKGDYYREQIMDSLQKALAKTSVKEPVNIYANLVLWKVYKEQDNSLSNAVLSDLILAVLEYAKQAEDIQLINDVALELNANGEKAKSKQLYSVYVNKIITAETTLDELKTTADDFYKQANIELSEAIYDIYIDKSLSSKEKLPGVIIDIAKQFSCQSKGLNDIIYAEKIFNKLAEKTKDAFDEELLYLRGCNLEKAHDYTHAKEVYADLISRYPRSRYIDKVNYKSGIIAVYVLRDIDEAIGYFERLAPPASPAGGKENVNPEIISSFYQLGLISQWRRDFEKAKQYYNKLIEKSADKFIEKVSLAAERLKEIEAAGPIEYNLKTFLDVSLKEENAFFNMSKLDLQGKACFLNKNHLLNLSVTAYPPESGCMQVKLDYLWSGDLGGAKPLIEEASFDTQYIDEGVKLISLVVVSSNGILDRSMELVEVY